MDDFKNLTENEWRKKLKPTEFEVLRQKATERAFTGKYLNNKEQGIYHCKGCGNEIFTSETKFDSGSGWPSFFEPLSKESIETEEDQSFGMTRVEIKCSRCGSHLGHLFDDAFDQPTGMRYCINSLSLEFEKQE